MCARLDEYPLLEPVDRDAWRVWLEANHRTSGGVWLAIGKKGGTRTKLTYEEAVNEALRYGWIDSTVRRLDDHRFQQLLTPRKPGSTWSQSNKARVARLEEQGLMMPAGRAAVEAARADGSWNVLNDVEDLVVPEDLASALAAEPAAEQYFGGLAASQRKIALYWIASAKRPETRVARIAKTVQAAAQRRLPW